MLRGTMVKVNKAEPKHLVGVTGIVIERIKRSGYIRVRSLYKGDVAELCYPEDALDIIEPPVEL